MKHLDYRIYKSIVARLQKDWEDGTDEEYLAMDWIAGAIFAHLRAHGYLDAPDLGPRPEPSEESAESPPTRPAFLRKIME
jgi:hypothetical protein